MRLRPTQRRRFAPFGRSAFGTCPSGTKISPFWLANLCKRQYTHHYIFWCILVPALRDGARRLRLHVGRHNEKEDLSLNDKIDIIGVYKIEADEPCFLIEMVVSNVSKVIDLGKITQELEDQQKENWQVPYLEHIIDEKGDKILADDFKFSDPEYWKDSVRIAFFFHYLNIDKPLLSPYGNITLPEVTSLPGRLKIIKYEAP
jgi:hypothetical protein